MDFPAVRLMCLEQEDRSLEEHLEEFLDLAHLTTFPDDCLCGFLLHGLNAVTTAQLSASFVEWVLASCGSAFTVEDATSPTPHPVPSQSHPDGEKYRPEPTAGSATETATMYKPAPIRATEDHITTEPEQRAPDQSLPQSPAIVTSQSPMSPFCPSVPPLPLSSGVPHQTCREPSSPEIVEPTAPPTSSVCYDLSRPADLAPEPALLPPSTSPWTIGRSVSPVSLGTSAPPRSDVTSPLLWTYGPSAMLWSSTPSATACSALPQAPPTPSVAPAHPQTSGSPPRSREVVRCVSVAVIWFSTISPLPQLIGYAVGSFLAVVFSTQPHGGPHHHLSMAPPSVDAAVGCHSGCGLGYFHHALLKALHWLSPSSAPPWTLLFSLLLVSRPPPEPPPASLVISSPSPGSSSAASPRPPPRTLLSLSPSVVVRTTHWPNDGIQQPGRRNNACSIGLAHTVQRPSRKTPDATDGQSPCSQRLYKFTDECIEKKL
ncbi:hypothetical protein PO909_029904 [Leuciscus waleckii]